jgi:multiple sugar transport system substrate-binding protein
MARTSAHTRLTRRRFIVRLGTCAVALPLLGACAPTMPAGKPETKPADSAKPAEAAKPAEPQAAPSSKSGAQVTLRYEDWQLGEEPGGTGWRTLISEFEQANPNIKIEQSATPLAQYPAKITTQSKAQQAPDVFKVADPWLLTWAEQGFLMGLEPFIAKQGGSDYKKDFYGPVVQVGSHKGELYALPSFSGVLLLQYNTEMFREAGLDPNKPPANWPELLEYSEKLTKKDSSGRASQWGFGLHGANQTTSVVRFIQWIDNNGGSVLNQDNTASALDSPEAIGALKFWSELATVHGVVPPGATDVEAGQARSLFAQEKTAMFQSIVWAIDLVASENPKIRDKVGFGPFPTQIGKSLSPQFMYYLGISADSKYPEEAWRLADYICSKEGQIKAYKIARFTPARRSSFESPEVQSDPYAQIAVKLAETIKPSPPIPQWSEIVNAVGDAMQQTLTKARTPEDAMTMAHQRANEILKRS